MKFRDATTLKLKTHIKLLEAIAMVLALFVWAMEWSSVQQWTSASSDLRASIGALQDAHSVAHLSAVIQLESAVTRATRDYDSQSDSPLSDYAVAWKSSDVRNKWLRRTENTTKLLSNLITVLQSTRNDNDFAPSESLKQFASELDSLKSDVTARLNVYSEAGTNIAIPDVDMMRGRDAGAIDQRLTQIHGRLAASINETVSALKSSGDSRSFAYRLIFIMGATLLLVCKVVEWWLEQKSVKPDNT